MVLVRWILSEASEPSIAHWVSCGDYEMVTLCGGRIPEQALQEVAHDNVNCYWRRCTGCNEIISDIGRRLHDRVVANE